MTLAQFIERPLRVARALAQGESDGSYMEACILISGLISAMAAHVWPGERIDRKRFVEFWIRFSGNPDAFRTSVPLLLRTLRGEKRFEEAELVKGIRPEVFGPGQDCRILTGADVDADEHAVLNACPALDLPTLRRHAYPTIFYEHVRSKLVHEYDFGFRGKATAWPMTRKLAPGISYVNHLLKAEDRLIETECGPEVVTYAPSVRLIHFHFDWLIELTRTLAANADRELSVTPAPLEHPNWWLPRPPSSWPLGNN